MLIALLALLGVDLIVIVVLLAIVISRKRWVRHQPGAFPGAIRVTGGKTDGLGAKWRGGYGRWVRDILVWTKRPFLFRNELVPGDLLAGERPAGPGDVKRLGDDPIVIQITTGAATVEIAARGQHRDLLRGPYGDRVDEAGNAVSLMQSRKSG
jgi:Protein of unknown function (DUF2550)